MSRSQELKEIEKIAKRLESPDKEERIAAVKDMEYKRRASTVRHLLHVAAFDKEYSVREAAQHLLEKNLPYYEWPRVAIPVLADALKYPNENYRAMAVKALGWTRKEAAVKHILTMLDDYEKDVRYSAVGALENIKTPSSIPHLAKRLRKDEYVPVRNAAAYALGRIGDAKGIPPLVRALKRDENGVVRRHAVEALRSIGMANDYKEANRVVPHIARALRDREAAVQAGAIESFQNLKPRKAIPHLLEVMKDKKVGKLATGPLGEIIAHHEREGLSYPHRKAWRLVKPYFNKNRLGEWEEEPQVVFNAYQAALKGKITEKNARLYVKQLRALKGSLK